MQLILRVYLEQSGERHVEVPVTPETTCADVLDLCRVPGTRGGQLIELWRGCERPVQEDEGLFTLLQQWGMHRAEVRFYFQQASTEDPPPNHRRNAPPNMPATSGAGGGPVTSAAGGHARELPPQQQQQQNTAARQNGLTDHGTRLLLGPGSAGGGDLTLTELQEMAARQQSQIERQEQALAAREQRLRLLRQQESKQAQQLSDDSNRVQRMRESVESQEQKLKRLRALRGQLDTQQQGNASLATELSSIKLLFNEKEKELSMAVARVEELSKQLDMLKRGSNNAANGSSDKTPAALELEKLKQELLHRNKLNEDQNNKLATKRHQLQKRQNEMSTMDKRIEELTQRLRRKRDPSHRQRHQPVPPKPAPRHVHGTDQYVKAAEAAAQPRPLAPNKQDPRYQSLPPGSKFPPGAKENGGRMANGTGYGPGQQQRPAPSSSQQARPPGGGPYATHAAISAAMASTRNAPARPAGRDPTVGSRGHQEAFNAMQEVLKQAQALPVASQGTSQPHHGTSQSHHGTSQPHQATSQPQHIPQQQHRSSPQYANVSAVGEKPNNGEQQPPPPEPSTLSAQQRLFGSTTYSTTVIRRPRGQDNKSSLSSTSDLAPSPPVVSVTPVPFTSTGDAAPVPGPRRPPIIAPGTVDRGATANYKQLVGQLNAQQKELDGTDGNRLGRKPPSPPVSPGGRVGRRAPSPMKPPRLHPPGAGASKNEGGMTSPPVMPRRGLLGVKPRAPTPDAGEGAANNVVRLEAEVFDDLPPVSQSSPVIPDAEDKQQAAPGLVVGPATAAPVNKPTLRLRTSIREQQASGAAAERKKKRRVSFDPLALLLDASLEGELELVQKTAGDVDDPSAPNDEGITALHNAICAGHLDVVKFLVTFGCNVNSPDSDGWNPLHCAASCNNLAMVRFLVEHGACIFASTLSDQETAAEKCEEDEDGYDGCSQYLYSIQEKLGILNNGAVYALYDYAAANPDELGFQEGDLLLVLRKGDDQETDWWWARLGDAEGYVPRNLLGLHPRVKPSIMPTAEL